MKIFLKNKICLILIISQFLSSCTILMWTPKSTNDKVEKFFIDKENNRVVLIGGQKSDDINGYYNYSIGEQTKDLVQIFELGQKSGYTSFTTSPENIEIKGSKLQAESINIKVGTKGLSKSEINFLKSKLDKSSKNSPSNIEGKLNIANNTITLYPASEESVKNLCSNKDGTPDQVDGCIKTTKLSTPWKNKSKERFTTKQKTLRALATPVTVALDVTFFAFILLWIISADHDDDHHHHHR